MSYTISKYVAFDNLIKKQKALIREDITKEEYEYQSVSLLVNFYLIVESFKIKQDIKKEFLDFYKNNYKYENVESILYVIEKVLEINIVVEEDEILASKWMVVNKMFLRKEYKLIKNEYDYLIEYLNEYTYLSYKDIK